MAEKRLAGRRDQGNQGHRRRTQLQELDKRSGGKLSFVGYTRQGTEYRVQLDEDVLVLRSPDIDPFITGVEMGIRLMAAMDPEKAQYLLEASVERPVSGLEPAERLPEPQPVAVQHPDAAERLNAQWPAVPGADRYLIELRNKDLKNPMWRPLGRTSDTAIEAEVEPGPRWQVRVRAEDTTGTLAMSDWAVVDVTPAKA